MTSQASKLAKWEEIRNKGKTRYILVAGVLFWGLITATLSTLIVWLRSDGSLEFLDLIWPFVVFPITGIFWGTAMWWFMERMYRRQALGRES
jgi:hypothetical protein